MEQATVSRIRGRSTGERATGLAPRRAWGWRWAATALAFPLGGLLATTAVGSVDSSAAALGGGLLAGVVLGAAQALLGPGLPRMRWAAATAAGVALGLWSGASLVGFEHTMSALVVQGAVCGAVVGAAQAAAVSRRRGRVLWVPLTALAWAAGWAATVGVGVDVERGYAVFGAAGALVATAVTGVALAVWQRSWVRS